MNVLFVNHGEFDSQSAMHVFYFANELASKGFDCVVAVPRNPEMVGLIGEPRFSGIDFEQIRSRRFAFSDRRGPDIVHAWTPREIVRQVVEPLVAHLRCSYIVHLEDNEELLAANAIGMTVGQLKHLPAAYLDRIIPPHLSHPHRAEQFINQASGITVITDRLLEFKPPELPGAVIWPSYGEAFPKIRESNPELRKILGLGEETFVVVYPGNVHSSNLDEVRSLYLAISLLNRRGHRARLVRLGVGHVPLSDVEPHASNPHCVELGFRPSHMFVAEALAMADALVQPGCPGAFNDFRFPSKLPEFLVSGRPVVLPNTNIGLQLMDGVNCLHLRSGTAIEIADALATLISDAQRRLRIGAAGRDFALRTFSWERAAEKLEQFYVGLTA